MARKAAAKPKLPAAFDEGRYVGLIAIAHAIRLEGAFSSYPCAVNRAGFLNRLILDVSRYHPAFAGWQERVL